MRPGPTILLYLTSGGMQLTWIYAWASFSLITVTGRPFPLFEATGTMVLAAAFTLLHRGRHWRIIQILGLHLLGLALAAYRWLYLCTDRTLPFLNGKWLDSLFAYSRDGQARLFLVLLLFWALAIWVAGIALGFRRLDERITGSRFDMGLAALFALLLLDLTLRVRAGIEVSDAITPLTLCTYFVFGLLSLGLVRYAKDRERSFMNGYHGIGVLLTFVVIVLLFGSGLFLLGLSQMTLFAETGLALMKDVTNPLGPVIVSLLRFIFSHHKPIIEEQSGASGIGSPDLSHARVSSDETPLFLEISLWAVLVLASLVGLFLVSFGFWHLFRWLLRKRGPSKPSSYSWAFAGLWFRALKQFFNLTKEKVMKAVKGFERPQEIYGALLIWGRHSGLSPFPSETPMEYCRRLGYHFPQIENEIRLIVRLFNVVVYGERRVEKAQLDQALWAWRKLRSPRIWPARIKALFFHPAKSSVKAGNSNIRRPSHAGSS
jgi:hypothetical protein